jgi:hypothetical protein
LPLTERERLEAKIAALQARLDALPQEPDLSEAVEAAVAVLDTGRTWNYRRDWLEAVFRAAYPALRKAFGHEKPAWPDDEMLQKMKDQACVDGYPRASMTELARRIREWQEANNG